MRSVLGLAFVLLAPGAWLTLALGRHRRLHFSHVLGLSLALPPLLTLWWDTAGGVVPVALTVALYVGSAMAALLLIYQRLRVHSLRRLDGFLFISGGVWLLILAWRFVQSAGLVLPLWVDSLHHTHVVQLLVREGRLPRAVPAYEPVPFYYHYGFHLITATLVRLSGLAEPQAVLMFGQVANALLSLGLYRLTVSLTRSRQAGLLAAILTGFISRFPGYYLSWGRYSLLMGVLLLSFAMAQVVDTWRAPHGPNIVILALLVAGLFLTHYLTTLYFIAFVGVLTIGGTFLAYPTRRRGLMAVALACALALGLTLPWLIRIFPHLDFVAYARTPDHADLFTVDSLKFRYQYIAHLFNGHGSWFVAAWAVPTGLLVFWRRRTVRLLVLWVGVLALLSQEALFKINPFRADLLAITLFVPGNALAAYGMTLALNALRRWSGGAYAATWQSLMVAALTVWGMGMSVNVVNPVTVLATPADMEAMAWIGRSTPQEARFLIGATPWQGNLYRGTDGGWWIPLLTGRRTVLPPGIFYTWGDPAYIREVAEVGGRITALTGCDAAFWDLVRSEGVTHVYIGPQAGPLKPEWFTECEGVELLYHQNGVYIYGVP